MSKLSRYAWGVRGDDYEPFLLKVHVGGARAHVPGAVEIHEVLTDGKGACLLQKQAKELSESYRSGRTKVPSAQPPAQPVQIMQVAPGAVVVSADGEGNHHAIVLRVGISTADILMFSSRPDWADRHRLATQEELAFAAFHNKRLTHLCLARREIRGMHATGVMFPEDRTERLEFEFMGVTL